ncbi:unnamed protein product [Effrenium voratum]|nr:unnamed protein product [Effrenium voratum]
MTALWAKLAALPPGRSVKQVLPARLLGRDSSFRRYLTDFNNAMINAKSHGEPPHNATEAGFLRELTQQGIKFMPQEPSPFAMQAAVSVVAPPCEAPAVRGLVAPAASAARGASTVRTAQTRRAADVVKPFTLGALAALVFSRGPRGGGKPVQRLVPMAAEEKKEASSSPDSARMNRVVQRLTNAEISLRRWGYVVEIIYTWLGLISLAVASFAAYSQGGLAAFRSAMGLGLASVALSVVCSLVGWFQARSCRALGRRCGLAAGSLEPGGPVPPPSQMSSLPPLSSIEVSLRSRQRTAWLGALFGVVGLQSMVGLMVGKVLATSGGFSQSPGINLDIFTLLAVSNSVLGHVLAGGLAAIQQGSLPQSSASDDNFQGWGK